jgi:hypothetical protein
VTTFNFRFTTAYRLAALPFGVTPSNAHVSVGDGRLVARFGPWRVDTAIDNVDGTEITGPYSLVKTIGPAHLSLADRGLTFATNPDRGLCVRFRQPVAGIEPTGRLRHPGLTVTVAEVDRLAEVIGAASIA